MNPRIPQNIGKFLSSCTTGGFSRRTQLHGIDWLTPQWRYYVPVGGVSCRGTEVTVHLSQIFYGFLLAYSAAKRPVIK
jgi:hypothetical protein